MLKHTLALMGLSFLTLSANAALFDRGNGLIYDDVLDITWLQDANYAMTSGYAAENANGSWDSGTMNIQSSGHMGWGAGLEWAENLVYQGHSDWRLPSARLINPANPCYADDGSCDQGYNNTHGELAHLFHVSLGNDSDHFSSSIGNATFLDGASGESVSFSNLQSFYWYQEAYSHIDNGYIWDRREGEWFYIGIGNGSWGFDFQTGYTDDISLNYEASAVWAVADGDIAAVPIPAAAWLFGSAFLGLVGIKRRQ